MKISREDYTEMSEMRIDISAERGEIRKNFLKKVSQPRAQNRYSLECLMLSTLKMKSVGRNNADESALNAKLTRQLLTLVGDEILEAPQHLKDIKLEKKGTTREEVKQRRINGKIRRQEEAAQEADKTKLALIKEDFNKDLIAIAYESSEQPVIQQPEERVVENIVIKEGVIGGSHAGEGIRVSPNPNEPNGKFRIVDQGVLVKQGAGR